MLAAWFALIALQAATGWPASYPLGFVANLYNAEFFVGMLVATLLRRHAAWRPLACLAAGTGLFLATGLFDDFGPAVSVHAPPLRAAYAAGAGLALYGLAGAELARQQRGRILPIPEWLRQVGSASYSLYLVHIIVLLVIQQGLRMVRHAVPIDVGYLVAVGVTVAGAVLFSRLLEYPMLRRLHGLVRRASVPAAP